MAERDTLTMLKLYSRGVQEVVGLNKPNRGITVGYIGTVIDLISEHALISGHPHFLLKKNNYIF